MRVAALVSILALALHVESARRLIRVASSGRKSNSNFILSAGRRSESLTGDYQPSSSSSTDESKERREHVAHPKRPWRQAQHPKHVGTCTCL